MVSAINSLDGAGIWMAQVVEFLADHNDLLDINLLDRCNSRIRMKDGNASEFEHRSREIIQLKNREKNIKNFK
jgi:hypothetical protein